MQQMTPAEFEDVKNRVNAATALVSSRIAAEWDAPQRQKAVDAVVEIRALVEENNLATLEAGNILRGIADRYGERLGLSEEEQRDVRDAALLIEILAGPVKLGIEGSLDPRDQELILAFLEGLEYGLQ
tara:strand:+ start:488 stop:871 length:384 start_codon:yes stop_codon:yes gene_type:complete